jgi:anti-sigma factor (TIGR02949 family)
MICKDVHRCVHVYIDGELTPQDALEVEGHLEECPRCKQLVEFEWWFKHQIRTSVGSVQAPADLSGRVRSSLARAERYDRVRYALPRGGALAALAAGVVLAIYLPSWLAPAPQPRAPGRAVFDYVAERHAHRLPPEITGGDEARVGTWFQDKVDFAVRPPRFRNEPVQLVGGRISNVGDRQAAHLFYEHNGRPLTVVVFQDADIPLGGTQPVQVGSHVVHFGQSRGYNVAVWNQGGVSYAVSSDLDQPDMFRLVSSVP